jgi:thymidylate synthase (FAD)
MKLIESKAEYIPQEEGLGGIYKAIELAGRTAYHSQDKITSDSAKDFVDRMIKSKHGAALEHGTVYLIGRFSSKKELFEDEWAFKYIENPYTKTVRIPLDKNNRYNGPQLLYVTTNYRVLVENGWLDDLKEPEDTNTVISYNPTEFHEKRYTIRFTCSRAIAQELTRHRVFSYLMESQRYINYSKERHGGGITFIIPSWCNFEPTQIEEYEQGNLKHTKVGEYALLSGLLEAEEDYNTMLSDDCAPQQARDVLPNATKTELIMTGFSSDWRHVLDLRLFEKTGKVAPDMLDLMQKAQASMQEAGIWEDIMSKPSKFE